MNPGLNSSARSPQPRVVVLTDISSLTSGVREPDDGQSLIRLLLYSNDLDVAALIASSSLGHGQVVRPELIHDVVDAYGHVHANLLLHDTRYPSAQMLHTLVGAGQPVAGRNVPVAASIGHGKDTDASRRIVEVVDRPDPRPVWVLIWGGSADLAQALWHVRATRSPAERDAFVAQLRVHAIYDQELDRRVDQAGVSRPVLHHAGSRRAGDVPRRRATAGWSGMGGDARAPGSRATRRAIS